LLSLLQDHALSLLNASPCKFPEEKLLLPPLLALVPEEAEVVLHLLVLLLEEEEVVLGLLSKVAEEEEVDLDLESELEVEVEVPFKVVQVEEEEVGCNLIPFPLSGSTNNQDRLKIDSRFVFTFSFPSLGRLFTAAAKK